MIKFTFSSFKVFIKKQIFPIRSICFLFYLFFVSGVCLHSQAEPLFISENQLTKKEASQLIQTTLIRLDRLAARFHNVQCSNKDDLCWWFLFHLAIGESGPGNLSHLLSIAPERASGNLAGEAHVFQVPAYSLIKGVNPNTKLQSGQRLEEYILSRDWIRALELSSDREPSWYLVGRAFYKTLRPIHPEYYEEKSCMGAHYLLALSIDEAHLPYFQRELDLYHRNLRAALEFPAAEALKDPQKADLLTHSFEALCLSGQRELIDAEHLIYTLAFLDEFDYVFEEQFTSSGSAENFLKSDLETVVLTGDILGHLRHGLRICANLERNRLNKSIHKK